MIGGAELLTFLHLPDQRSSKYRSVRYIKVFISTNATSYFS